MKFVYAAVAAMMFVAAPAFAAAPTADAKLANKQGEITFKHSTHKALDCTKCHADAKGGKLAPLGKEKGHATCLDCHKEKVKADATAKAPTKCTECHTGAKAS